MSSIKIGYPSHRTQLETDHITKALIGMSYLRQTYIDSDMNRQL